MKKLFLLCACAMMASVGFAQSKTTNQKVDQRENIAGRAMQQASPLRSVGPVELQPMSKTAPRKAEAYDNGVWFARPEGALVTGYSDEGYGYYVNRLIVAPYHRLVFQNLSEDPGSTWWVVNGREYSAEEDGSFIWGTPGCYSSAYDPDYDEQYTTSAWYMPELTDGGVTYRFGEPNNDNYYTEAGVARSSAILVDTIRSISYVDANTTQGGYAFGRLEGGNGQYLFGSGSYTFKTGDGDDDVLTAMCIGFADFYGKPQSSLYVEHISLDFYTAANLLSNGATLRLRVIACEEDGNGALQLTDRIIADLTATEDDVIRWGGPYTTNYTSTGECYYDHVIFKETISDGIGNVYAKPFSINEPFALIVTGFENPDVDGTGIGEVEADEDHQTYGMVGVWAAPDGDVWMQTVYGGGALSVAATFYGCFDYVEAQDELYSFDDDGNITDTYSNLNVVRISNDGQTCSTEGAADADHNFESAILYTAFPWFGELDIENYYTTEDIFEEYPWITNWTVTQYVDSDGDRTGMYGVAFECEPLEDGEEGRMALLHFSGKGYTSALPVVVLQGDVEFDPSFLGIKETAKTVTSTAKTTYSLSGLRAGNAVKGIVVKDGKKVVVK